MHHWILASLLALATIPASAADLIDFWNTPRHGGNSFNRLPPDQAYFDALRGYGASWVRLSYDKWHPAERDFLLGNADAYQGLVNADLKQLVDVLDRAHAAGLKVVITPLSLPGMRWAQNNQDRFDDRLWQDKRFWTQAAHFWRDLAHALKDHPGVAAYNLVNEPAPEKHGGLAEHADLVLMKQWYAREQGGSRDLPALYRQLLAAIREVDDKTPVMVDAGWYAAADAFGYWPRALADQRVLYSVHMYEPYAATSAPNLARPQPIPYPGPVPFAGQLQPWDGERVARYLQQPVDWADAQRLPRSRLVVGEFGCMRRLAGCRQYLEDVLTVLDRHQLHWAFYSFREDSWDGMDYELGTAKVPWRYWQAIDKGTPDPLVRQATAAFEPIRRRLRPGPSH
ncbi:MULTISPECIES: cellulase family glycosylhydrolase [unclassified Pseudomonas]|uniref:glycoside hydrolase family 5 protein n=1 Tax=unclassified Pseudomonas TaxID=196821 RepID=UPI00244BFA28|nr:MULTISPECIES: cellulase family glycosylhydrolase [unclassified Pseudomonas]MDH0301160.1 glycoside hydrolase family 5 protein [Pseudomonas sp. GD04091]MDH1986585.1 glycoside hydrolase family 5 protein [Pseudomonas sp. GD03689]